jgi:regulator of protease activity HflC (stomatin/prohibitin superfamily)
MKKFLAMFSFALVAMLSFTSCIGCTTVDADEETVLIDKPWFWGHGGVQENAVETGLKWIWWSTDTETFKIVPVKHQVDMNDLFSDDNTPLDFHTIIITQIEKGKSPILLKNYGKDWFDTNIYNEYCKFVRNYISQNSPFDLMSNRQVLDDIDAKVLKQTQELVAKLSKDKEFPVIIKQVTIGKAIPNEKQLEEMNNTAKAVQAKQTQDREAEVQVARGKAERERAKADKAYMEQLGLTVPQFIELRKWEVIEKKDGANIDVLVGGDNSTQMWNIRR